MKRCIFKKLIYLVTFKWVFHLAILYCTKDTQLYECYIQMCTCSITCICPFPRISIVHNSFTSPPSSQGIKVKMVLWIREIQCMSFNLLLFIYEHLKWSFSFANCIPKSLVDQKTQVVKNSLCLTPNPWNL